MNLKLKLKTKVLMNKIHQHLIVIIFNFFIVEQLIPWFYHPDFPL